MPPTLINLKNPVFNGVNFGEKESKKRSNKVKVNVKENKDGNKVVVVDKKNVKNDGNSTKEDLRFLLEKNKVNKTSPV